jgi:hypothetical protein
MKTVKSSKERKHRLPMLGGALKAIKAEIEAAGEALGFDVSDEDWIEKLNQESRFYPLPIDDKDHDQMLALMSPSVRGRVWALEQIFYLIGDLLPEVERGNIASEIDSAMEGLRRAMALAPAASPLTELKEVA